ncbi:hypothetical protein [Mesorhizobium sp. ORM16]|uniref:hypothetical protein n=1 Tax=Mesorhizobium sp. ORM16 TaxID=3376989 RepID=UPI003857CA64
MKKFQLSFSGEFQLFVFIPFLAEQFLPLRRAAQTATRLTGMYVFWSALFWSIELAILAEIASIEAPLARRWPRPHRNAQRP